MYFRHQQLVFLSLQAIEKKKTIFEFPTPAAPARLYFFQTLAESNIQAFLRPREKNRDCISLLEFVKFALACTHAYTTRKVSALSLKRRTYIYSAWSRIRLSRLAKIPRASSPFETFASAFLFSPGFILASCSSDVLPENSVLFSTLAPRGARCTGFYFRALQLVVSLFFPSRVEKRSTHPRCVALKYTRLEQEFGKCNIFCQLKAELLRCRFLSFSGS